MGRSARRANLTSERAVRALKWQAGDPVQFEVKDIDHPGFYIRVGRGGIKTWLYRYKLRGQLRRINLGRWPFVDCVEAFKSYFEHRKQVMGGVDVYTRQVTAGPARIEPEKYSTLTLSELFHDHYYPRHALLKRSKKNDWRYFVSKIEPALGSRPAIEITPQDVERLIRPIEVAGYNNGRLTLALLRKMFNWAVEPSSGAIPGEGSVLDSSHPNPCQHYRLNPTNKPKQINRYLKMQEIRALWRALGDDPCSRVIKLQLLTGCRVGEVCGMRESELDRDAEEWVIPASRVKTGRAHLVPLTTMALELIGPARSELVFPGHSKLGHVTNYAVNQRLKRVCARLSLEGVSTHTMRRTFVTHLARLGVSVEIRNRLTNHADRSVDGIYCQHDYLQQKQAALDAWEQEVVSLIRPDGLPA